MAHNKPLIHADFLFCQVGKGTFEGGYTTQGKGFKHCIPRVDVSVREKHLFADMLSRLAVDALKQGRDACGVVDEQGKPPLMGASAYFTGDAACLSRQLAAAAAAGPDFFAIEGAATASDVALISEVLDTNRRREVVLKSVDTRGFDVPDDKPTALGFDIPVMLLSAVPPCHEDFGDIVRAVAAEPRMMCLSAPTVVAQADRDALLPLLQGEAPGGGRRDCHPRLMIELACRMLRQVPRS